MITLSRVIDMKFDFNLAENDSDFIKLRDHIKTILEKNKEDVHFMSNLLIKVNNSFHDIVDEIGYGDKDGIRPHYDLIKRIVNNFVFSNKYKYLAENFVMIANSYKELNMFLLKNRQRVYEKFNPEEVDFLRAVLIEISKLEYSIERRL